MGPTNGMFQNHGVVCVCDILIAHPRSLLLYHVFHGKIEGTKHLEFREVIQGQSSDLAVAKHRVSVVIVTAHSLSLSFTFLMPPPSFALHPHLHERGPLSLRRLFSTASH